MPLRTFSVGKSAIGRRSEAEQHPTAEGRSGVERLTIIDAPAPTLIDIIKDVGTGANFN